jgi:hypothetical protein
MPGARWESFRQGDRAELLAGFALSSFAFTASVPRQEDVGHDFHCALTVPGGKPGILLAGPSFSVQVRSQPEPLTYTKSYEIDWLVNQDNPFFVCVVDRQALRCDFYSTWSRLVGFVGHGPQRTELLPGVDFAIPTLDDGLLRVPLGPPVLSLTAADAVGDRVAAVDVMRPWIEMDRRNIVRNHTDTHWIEGPTSWNTNQPPTAEPARWLFWNAKNLQVLLDNFGRTAVALLRTVEQARAGGDHSISDGATQFIEAAFESLVERMDPATIAQYSRIAGTNR